MAKFRKKPVVIDAFKWTGDETQMEDPVSGWMLLREHVAAKHGGTGLGGAPTAEAKR